MQYKSLLIIAFVLSIFSCNNQPAPSEGNSEKAGGRDGAGVIHLSAGQIKRVGITWAEAEKRAISTAIPLTGELCIHPENRAVVSALAAGIIQELNVGLNKSVRKGDLIATLRNPEMVDLQQQYLENADRLAFLQTEYDRYKVLKDDNATATKNFRKAEADLRAAGTTGQLLGAKLRFYGIDPEKISPSGIRTELRITAPVSGLVTAMHLSAGTSVQAGTAICEIADFTALHADLFVFEKDILKIKPGQKAAISFPGAPGKTLNTSVFAVDKVLDPAKNALRIHTRISNTGNLSLADGAYCDARLLIDEAFPAPALPNDAIVRDGLDEYVLLLDREENGSAFFKAVKVKTLGSEDGLTTFSAETEIPAGSKIVHKGAYFVWSQGKVEEFGEEE